MAEFWESCCSCRRDFYRQCAQGLVLQQSPWPLVFRRTALPTTQPHARAQLANQVVRPYRCVDDMWVCPRHLSSHQQTTPKRYRSVRQNARRKIAVQVGCTNALSESTNVSRRLEKRKVTCRDRPCDSSQIFGSDQHPSEQRCTRKQREVERRPILSRPPKTAHPG